MALVVANRVQETTTTAGTGTITLAGASAGYQSFAVIGNGNTTYYTIVDGNNWEVGIGTYTASGTTLSRDTVLSSSAAGAKINLSGNTARVFVDYPAEKAISDGYGTLPATNGGTGQTSYAVGDLLYASSTTALSKLADVATGNALISGGVSTAPAWGKIGLTTHVSGTLPVANGGTNATATPTAGAVAYGTGTAYAFTAAGTSGQVLTSAGTGAPTWTTPSAGSMTLISTQTANNTASFVEWTGLSGYDVYLLIFEGVQVASGSNALGYVVGTGSGPTYITSSYITASIEGGGGSVNTYNNTAANYAYSSIANAGANSITAKSLSGFAYINNMTSGLPLNGTSISYQVASGYCWNSISGVYLNNTTTKTAIKVYYTGNVNLVAGKFSLYGISS